MDQQKKQRQLKYNILIFALAVALILFGGFMALNTYEQNSAGFLQYEDKQLDRMAGASDGNLKTIFDDAQSSIDNIAHSRRIVEAVNNWLATGYEEPLDTALETKVFVQSDICTTVLLEKDGKIIYSLDGDTDYKFKKTKLDEHVRFCQNLNGNVFIAFDSKSRRGIKYTALLDLRRIYMQIAGSDTGEDFGLILLDKTGNIVIYPDDNNIMARSLENVEKPALLEGIEFLKTSQENGQDLNDSYQASQSNKTFRIDTLVSDNNQNKLFSIASVANYEPIKRLTKKTSIKLFIFFMTMAVGIGILVVTLIITRRRNQEALEELETLKEKNRIMEELQEKAENLAHMQRLETIGTLTSSIAHEFNNLLTPIMGYSIMTLEKLPPEEVEMYDNILEIYNASNKAKEIISRLSKLSRRDTDRKFDALNPDLVLNKAMNMTTPALPKNVDVIRKLNCSNVKVSGNEVQLSQLLLNLMINAFQAMGEEGGLLTLETKLVDKEVVISVKDTGCGIDDETKAKIFDPFFTTKVSGEGTGLGLAIALQSVEDHNGHIEVESEVGRGTTFSVYLPQLEESQEEKSLETAENEGF